MGGVLSVLSGMDLLAYSNDWFNLTETQLPSIRIITIGIPRVGNDEFSKHSHQFFGMKKQEGKSNNEKHLVKFTKNVMIYHFMNEKDPIHSLASDSYVHAPGQQIYLKHCMKKSMENDDLFYSHKTETYV